MQQQIVLPDPVRSALDAFVATTKEVFGEELRSVVLYGSAAVGMLRATSDVNVVVILARFDRKHADDLRESFRFAQAAIDLQVMFLRVDEIEDASREFAQKFADIGRRRVVLYGSDPFTSLHIPREALVRRVQQVLLNLTLRLREQYVGRSLREEQCAISVAEAAGPLRTSAATIHELEGGTVKSPKEALEIIVSSLGRNDLVELLPHFSQAREQRLLPAGHAADYFFLTAELAHALHDRAKLL